MSAALELPLTCDSARAIPNNFKTMFSDRPTVVKCTAHLVTASYLQLAETNFFYLFVFHKSQLATLVARASDESASK